MVIRASEGHVAVIAGLKTDAERISLLLNLDQVDHVVVCGKGNAELGRLLDLDMEGVTDVDSRESFQGLDLRNDIA